MVVQEAQRQAGIGAMVMSEISERAILRLELQSDVLQLQIQSSHLVKQKTTGYQMLAILKLKFAKQ